MVPGPVLTLARLLLLVMTMPGPITVMPMTVGAMSIARAVVVTRAMIIARGTMVARRLAVPGGLVTRIVSVLAMPVARRRAVTMMSIFALSMPLARALAVTTLTRARPMAPAMRATICVDSHSRDILRRLEDLDMRR